MPDWRILFHWLFALNNLLLVVFSANAFFLLLVAVRYRRPKASPPAYETEEQWPSVLVQLPLYNERHVVERLIEAVAGLDYPASRLRIQVLDDSTDDTSSRAKAAVRAQQARGRPIAYFHRDHRAGFKAGALSEGMTRDAGEFIAVFDADFIPPVDFLRRMLPCFRHDPKIGVVQARWEHLNPEQNTMTRLIALALDAHFAVEQIARSRGGLLMNFNGSATVLRRECIVNAGGWQSSTLVEDTDLSYHLQLQGWKIEYRPEIAVPGELPDNLPAFKLQQFRWAKGATQVLLRTAGRLIRSSKSAGQKMQGLLHLAGYLTSPLMLLSLLLSLPVVLSPGAAPFHWAILGVAAFFPPLIVFWGQIRLGRRWAVRFLWYPFLFLAGIGLAVAITVAIWEALIGAPNVFRRTPKYSGARRSQRAYALAIDWTTALEAALALYALVAGMIALQRIPPLAPFLFLYAAGMGFTVIATCLASFRPRSSTR